MIAAVTNSKQKRSRKSFSRQGRPAAKEASGKLREAASVKAALARSIDCIAHPDFDRPGVRNQILGPFPAEEPAGSRNVPAAEPMRVASNYIAGLGSAPLLTKEQELYLFRKMNYLKHLAREAQKKIPRAADKLSRVQQMERHLAEADATRDQILNANLRLVISIAKKYVNVANSFDELLSEGNMSLIQAAEKFDVSRGNRFSTYATRAIRNNLYHFVLDKHRKRQRVNCADETVLASATDEGTNEHLVVSRLEYIRRLLARVMNKLDAQKRAVLSSRFGLDYATDPRTLKEIACEMGVSRERIRQIQSRAMRELKLLVSEEKLDFPWEAI